MKLFTKSQKQLFTVIVFIVFLGITFLQGEVTTETTTTNKESMPSANNEEVAGASTEQSLDPEDLYQVVSVTDGDTIKISSGGTTQTVRIVGINTPETVDPRKSVECFGLEASTYMKSLLANQSVHLDTDETQSDQDRYGRLLRFVFLPDGRDVGLEMIKEGYARESLYSNVPHKYHEAYVAAQENAQKQAKGLWNEDTCPVE